MITLIKRLSPITIFLSIVLVSSCDNEKVNLQDSFQLKLISTGIEGVLFNPSEGYLVLKNYETLSRLKEFIKTSTQEELDNWEKQFGFVSVRQINKKLGDESTMLLDKEIELYGEIEELTKLEYSDFLIKNAKIVFKTKVNYKEDAPYKTGNNNLYIFLNFYIY